MPARIPTFPPAQQAQIIRAHQRDVIQVASLREEAENILRAYLGSRTLSRYDKEVELLVKLVYFGLTTGRAIQTLGEEYTGIWSHPSKSRLKGVQLASILLPTLPQYLLARFGSDLNAWSPSLKGAVQAVVGVLETAGELNLALFYLRGTYYDLIRRALGLRSVSATPENPQSRPPSYSLLGVLILVRLLYRLISYLRSSRASVSEGQKRRVAASGGATEPHIDGRTVSEILSAPDPDTVPTIPAEEDEYTMLDVASIPPQVRAGRTCTLCLEERRGTCATECGHLFDWDCIYGWGREKSECPLCRQALDLTKLLPIRNL
ncbi:hypothetical protein PENSPDRAFT_645173 [Peniophora sp. CONT]|nr:hypothetical protein PENSPDRAFT_645173 [Peniophora sp. CONT]